MDKRVRTAGRPPIFIFGPTAVGKSNFALALAQELDGVIINMDIGSFYTRLNIGVAKPDYRLEAVAHHLFDILDDPVSCNVMQYRERSLKLLNELKLIQKVPIFVGGSGFYLRCLLFPPTTPVATHSSTAVSRQLLCSNSGSEDSAWLHLKQVDAVRASQIHPNDTVRVMRALDIYYTSGIQPSKVITKFEPIASHGTVIYLDSACAALYKRINDRVHIMMDQGLEREARFLYQDRAWRLFLSKKNMIGYKPLFEYFSGLLPLDEAIKTIQKQTRHYAKRQACFWRMLQKMLQAATTKLQIVSFNVEECSSQSMIEYIKTCYANNKTEQYYG